MNFRLSSFKTVGAIAATLAVAVIPQMAQASTQDDAAEIAALKHQVYVCHHHKRHHRNACAIQAVSQVVERQTIIEKPVMVDRIVEREVEAPIIEVEKSVVIEQPTDEQRLVVEHSKHRKHLLHFGIPFIGVTLF
jgi:hypothetical protein